MQSLVSGSSRRDSGPTAMGKLPPYTPNSLPKMDILMIKDLATLLAMAKRSPYLALLKDVTFGQQDDQDWVYFLTRSKAGNYGDRPGDMDVEVRGRYR